MSFVYKSNDWKEVLEIIDKWYHEQSRARSTKNNKQSNKE